MLYASQPSLYMVVVVRAHYLRALGVADPRAMMLSGRSEPYQFLHIFHIILDSRLVPISYLTTALDSHMG
jgi:hypothetical protein